MTRALKISGDRRIGDAWGEVLEVDPQNKSELLERFSKIMTLPAQIKREVSKTGVTPEIYLLFMPKFETGLSYLNLGERWTNVVGHFSIEVVHGLAYCSDMLSRERPEPNVPTERLDELQQEVRALFQEVRDADLDPELKEFILNHLHLIDVAIQDYWITGAKNIKETAERVVGATGTRPSIWAKTQKSSYGQRFWNIVVALSVITGTVSDVKQLTYHPTPALQDTRLHHELADTADRDETIDVEFTDGAAKDEPEP